MQIMEHAAFCVHFSGFVPFVIASSQGMEGLPLFGRSALRL
jgi:hypothetical protein